MNNLLKVATGKILPVLLALVILFNITTDAVAQVQTFNPGKIEYNRQYTAVSDNTRIVIPSAQIQQVNRKAFEAGIKIQAAYDKKQADEAKAAAALKATYKYTEFDKTGYLTHGQWSGKRKDGSVKNTGFFGEIVIQGGKYRGKVITEASVMIKRNGKEIEVPLLNPFLTTRDIEVLRYGNINAGIIKAADFWLQQRQAQRLSPFASGKEIAEKSKWAYNDVTNMLQVSFLEVQKQKERKAAIAARIKKGEKNPYFFGKESDEWNQVAAEMQKQEDVENRAKAVMASNYLLSKQDAEKQVELTDEEYAKNEKRIARDTKDSIRAKIIAAQQARQAANIVVPLRPAAINRYMSVEEALSLGLITNEEINNIHHSVAGKYINKNVQAKFGKYITDESGHNTANFGFLGSGVQRGRYAVGFLKNRTIVGKALLWLSAAGEGLVTLKNPSMIYQRDYQHNEYVMDYYNMGTSFGFVNDLSLTTAAFASDAGVFKAIGLVSGAVLPQITTASSTAAKIILPSVQTGLVLGTYDGLNTLGDALGYKDFGKLNSTDWKKIGYNTGRGFTSGVIVGQYGRMIWGNQVAQKTLIAKPLSQQLANGARNVGLGMSEGAVFSVSGAAYDQANSLWLPAQGTPNYIGGNANAFAQMTPTSLLKDMVKFYFAIKLPGSVMFPSQTNNTKGSLKQNIKAMNAAKSMGVTSKNSAAIIKGLQERPALRNALVQRAERTAELNKLQKAQDKAVAKAQANPTAVNNAKSDIANNKLATAKSRQTLERYNEHLKTVSGGKDAVESELNDFSQKVDDYNNKVETYNKQVNKYNAAAENQNTSADYLKNLKEEIFNADLKEPQPAFSAKTQKYLDLNADYLQNVKQLRSSENNLKNIKSGDKSQMLSFGETWKEPSVNLLGVKPDLSVSQKDIDLANMRAEAYNSEASKAKRLAQSEKSAKLNNFYNTLDRYTFGIGGKTLKLINNKAFAAAFPLLLNYNIATTTPEALNSSLAHRAPAPVEVVDPKLFASFNTVPLPAGTFVYGAKLPAASFVKTSESAIARGFETIKQLPSLIKPAPAFPAEILIPATQVQFNSFSDRIIAQLTSANSSNSGVAASLLFPLPKSVLNKLTGDTKGLSAWRTYKLKKALKDSYSIAADNYINFVRDGVERLQNGTALSDPGFGALLVKAMGENLEANGFKENQRSLIVTELLKNLFSWNHDADAFKHGLVERIYNNIFPVSAKMPSDEEIFTMLENNINFLERNPTFKSADNRGTIDRRFYRTMRTSYVDPTVNGDLKGTKDFPFVKPVLIKTTLANGIHLREYGLAISDKPLPQGGIVYDSYENFGIKVSDDKTKTQHKWLVRDIVRSEKNHNIPVLIVSSVPDACKALMLSFQIMGYTSIGRYFVEPLMGPIAAYYNLPETNPKVKSDARRATSLVYATNASALFYQKLAKKPDGANKVTKLSNTIMFLSLLIPGLASLLPGSDWSDPTAINMIAIMSTIIFLGIGAAGIQQSGNILAKDIRHGKPADSISALAQLKKALGSLSTYFMYVAGLLFTGLWISMFGIMAAMAGRSWYVSTKAINASKINYSKKIGKIRADNAPKKEKEKAKTEEVKLNIFKQIRNFVFPELLRKDLFVVAVFAGLFLFCGSEIVVSQATKSIITHVPAINNWINEASATVNGVLQHVSSLSSEEDLVKGISTAITGLITMLPIILGRRGGSLIQEKYKNVDNLSKKILALSIALALGGTVALGLLGGSLGWGTLGLMFIANLGFANMFSLALGTIKDHVEEKYGKDEKGNKHPKYEEYKASAGTISTVALTACFFLPIIVDSLFKGAKLENNLNILFAAGCIFAGILSFAIYSAAKKKPGAFISNPFSWQETPSSDKFIYSDILNVYRSDIMEKKIMEGNRDLFYSEQFAADADAIEKELSNALGITKDQLNDAMTGFMPNPILSKEKKALIEHERSLLKEQIKKAFSDAGLSQSELEYLDSEVKKVEERKARKLSPRANALIHKVVGKIISSAK